MSKDKKRGGSNVTDGINVSDGADIAETPTAPDGGGLMDGNGPAPAAPAKRVESKAQRFRRLANMRIPKALKVLGNIENLTRKQSYEYTDEQADKIIAVLTAAVKRIVDGFSGSDSKPGGFML